MYFDSNLNDISTNWQQLNMLWRWIGDNPLHGPTATQLTDVYERRQFSMCYHNYQMNLNTVRYRYNALSFLQILHKITP